MARTRESEAMRWLADLGVEVPRYVVIQRDQLGTSSPMPFDPPYIVKVDLSLGGKGARGLVRRCSDEAELHDAISALLDADVTGEPVPAVVVEEAIAGEELYLSVSMDDVEGPMVRLAGRGGIGFDASLAAALSPGSLGPLLDHQLSALTVRADIQDTRLAAQLRHLADVLWRAFVATEAVLLEMNPIRWDGDRAVPVGVALEFDDNARPAAQAFWPVVEDRLRTSLGRAPTPRERHVDDVSMTEPNLPSVTFVELGGDVALLVVGGGASLLCFDRLRSLGLQPACFADHSPGAGPRKLQAIVEAGITIPDVRGAVFGAVVISLADCADYARGFVDAVRAVGVDPATFPLVVRLAGPNEEEAYKILGELDGVHVIGREGTIEDACDLLAQLLAPKGAE